MEKMSIEDEIEQMEYELAQKKQKLAQMQGVDQPQNGNNSYAEPDTNEVEYTKLKKKMLMKKMME